MKKQWDEEQEGLLEQKLKKSILVIPHQPSQSVKSRVVEMARYLNDLGCYDVNVLNWETGKPVAGAFEKIVNRSMEALRTSQNPIEIKQEDNLNWISIPYLLAPSPYCQTFNKNSLKRLLAQKPFDIIISANAYLFPVPDTFNGVYIYDVLDDHLSPDSGPAWKRTRPFTLGELQKAQHVMTISHGLKGLLAEEGFNEVAIIPNGVDLKAFHAITSFDVQAFRRQWQCEQYFTIAYIGNHGSWAGMEFLLQTFRQFQAEFPKSRLLVVGPGEEIDRYKRQYQDENIHFTGPVPPSEIAVYFKACDIGVLPFDLCPFTQHALPLKILEYGAAEKQVISSPLQELQTLGFPHIQLVALIQSVWVDALKQAALEWQQSGQVAWRPDWDETIQRYDWSLIWRKLEPFLEDSV